MALNANRKTLSLVLGAMFLFAAEASAEPASQPAGSASGDWPQYCGPNRDSIAVNSPKLLDAWPKEGPPLAWKSDWVGGYNQGGCGGPVVADGKVFVYATAKNPVGGGTLYKLVTPEVLGAAGWMADLPADLAKKIEDARVLKGRPDCQEWSWWEVKEPKEKEKQLDAFLAKKPALDKYIKDFLATLTPAEAAKYGSSIRMRLCVSPPVANYGRNGIAWDNLVNLSKLQGEGYATLRAAAGPWGKVTGLQTLAFHMDHGAFLMAAWEHSFTRSDTFVCLDAATGKTVWKKEFPLDSDLPALKLDSGFNAGRVLGVCATPAVWEGKCYFIGFTGLYCLSAKDGSLLWHVKCNPEHAAVLVASGVVYSQGTAYDAATGRLLWKTPNWKGTGWGTNMSPALWKSGGKTYIIASDEACNRVYCLDLETGNQAWSVKHDRAIFVFPSNFAVQVDGDILNLTGKTYKMTPTGLQPLKEFIGYEGGFFGTEQVIYQDHFYHFAGNNEGSTCRLSGPSCWDLKTGELQWNVRLGENTLYAPSIVADGKLFMPTGDMNFAWTNYGVAMLKATPERYAPLGSFAPDMIPWTPMAMAGGKLFVRTEVGISCYDLTQSGPYLDKTVVTKESVTFVFKQTGGGLVSKEEATTQKDIVIADAAAEAQPPQPAKPAKPAQPARPAKATIVGDTIVVDITGVPSPFGISCGAANSIVGKNGKPLPAFGWNESRVLKLRTCFDNTIVLASDQLLPQNGTWNNPATYTVAGATVTKAKADPLRKLVTLTTDKTWNGGEAITLIYPRFPVDQGEPLRETLTFTARERSTARFVKIDETTSGNWKGVYGAEGAVIVGDPAATAKCAVVTPSRNGGTGVWAGATTDARAVQKSGEAKDRIAAKWSGGWEPYVQIDVEFTDEKEHQVALYCLDWDKQLGGRAMTVEAWDPWRNVVLVDKQAVKEFTSGKYLVLNLKGHVELRLQINGKFDSGVASGVFFDPPAPTGK